MQTNDRASDDQQTSEEPIARLNYGTAENEDVTSSNSRVTWGPRAIALGVVALLIMVLALLLIIQGVYEVRPQ
jgi:hypothetical protein